MSTAYRVPNVINIIRFKGQIWRAGNRVRPAGSALRPWIIHTNVGSEDVS